MINFFKPEDFIGLSPATQLENAKRANEKLNAALGPEVFGTIENGKCSSGFSDRMFSDSDKHKAFLFNIKERNEKPKTHFKKFLNDLKLKRFAGMPVNDILEYALEAFEKDFNDAIQKLKS